MELEKTVIGEQEIEKLWQAFKVLDADGNGAISAEELGVIIRSLGQNLTEKGLRELIGEIDVDSSGTINFEEFKTLMVAKVGDRQSRLKLAFSLMRTIVVRLLPPSCEQ